jgi:hypothetical protein
MEKHRLWRMKMHSGRMIHLVLVVLVLLSSITVAGYAYGDGGYRGGGGAHGGGQYYGGGTYHGGGRSYGGGTYYRGGYGGYWRGGVWVGPGWGWGGWGPWWWGAPYYPYYQAPPVVIERQPPVYIEPEPEPEEQTYWYYCRNPQGYYPYVKQCPGGWMKVVPSPVPPDVKE